MCGGAHGTGLQVLIIKLVVILGHFSSFFKRHLKNDLVN